jgi:hypothetical protein
MKRKGEQDRGGDDAEKRRRQFEDERGLSDRPELPLDEDVEENVPPPPPASDEEGGKEGGGGKAN